MATGVIKFMHLKYPLILLLVQLCSFCTYGSADTAHSRLKLYNEKALRVLVGGHLQMTKDENGKEQSRKYMELGLHLTTLSDWSIHHPPTTFTYGPSLEFSPGATNIYGFKLSSWINVSLFALGLSTVYYTDFNRGNFKIRPELGLGFPATKLTFGLNIPTFGNADFPQLKSSLAQLSLNILLKVKTIKRTEHNIPEPQYLKGY